MQPAEGTPAARRRVCRCTHARWSVQVQDRALDVLACHLSADPVALAAHLPLVLQASQQQALSVRKRAVDVLWSCYINGGQYGGKDAAGRDAVAVLLIPRVQISMLQEPVFKLRVIQMQDHLR